MSKVKTAPASSTIPAPSSLSASDVIHRRNAEADLQVAEKVLYLEIVSRSGRGGQFSPDDRQAAEIIANKHGWNFDDDIRILSELHRIKTNYPDLGVAYDREWLAVTTYVTETKQLDEDHAKLMLAREVERQRLLAYSRLVGSYSNMEQTAKQKKPHLFE